MNLIESLKEAEAVAVGIGPEFAVNIADVLEENQVYKTYREKGCLQKAEGVLNDYIINSILYIERKNKNNSAINRMTEAYDKLAQMLGDKNYFVVTTCSDGVIFDSMLDREKIAAPCGSVFRAQNSCMCYKDGGESGISELDKCLEEIYSKLMDMKEDIDLEEIKKCIPKCKNCGKEYIFNVQGVDDYNENGYMPEWENYTRWLQRTLNRKLVLLELGMDFKVPTVVRWPFEKIAMLNNKAVLYRINGKFPQLPEEIKDKGISIKEDSVRYITEEL